MPRNHNRLPKPGTGIVGFGCAFVVVIVAGIPAVLGSGLLAWAVLAGASILIGLIAARFGEPFFERMLKVLAEW